MSFKRTCALNAISNAFALIHFASGKLCSHENLMSVWNFISIKIIDKKSILVWVSFCLNSCEHKQRDGCTPKWDFQPKWNLIPVRVHFASHVNVLLNESLNRIHLFAIFWTKVVPRLTPQIRYWKGNVNYCQRSWELAKKTCLRQCWGLKNEIFRWVYKSLITSKLIKTTFIAKWCIFFFHRGWSRTPATSNMKFFVTLVNDWKP